MLTERLAALHGQYDTEVVSKSTEATNLWVPLYLWLHTSEGVGIYRWERLGRILHWLKPYVPYQIPDNHEAEVPWVSISNTMRYAAGVAGVSEYHIYYCLHREVYPRLYTHRISQ